MILFLHGALARRDKGILPRRIRSFLMKEGLPFKELSALDREDYFKEVGALVKGDTLLALGGDGTLSLVADALMGMPEEERPAFLLIPGGTLGDGARNIWGRKSLPRLLSSLKDGRRKKIDVLRAELEDGPSVHFLYMISAGAFSRVASRASRRSKALFGRLTYLAHAFFEAVFSRKEIEVSLLLDGGKVAKERLSFLLVLNGRRIAGLPLRRYGPIDDGKAEVRLGRGKGLGSALRTFASLPGDIHKTPSLLADFSQMVEICIDGEPYRSTSLRIEVLRKALEILIPSE